MPTFFHHGVSIPTPMTPSRCYSGSWAAAVTVVVAPTAYRMICAAQRCAEHGVDVVVDHGAAPPRARSR
jgi:hypothetical protein